MFIIKKEHYVEEYERCEIMSEKMDVLDREGFIQKLESLIALLAETHQGCCFGIDGAWGSRKSFVIEKFENRIKDIQSEKTADNKYYVFHYDCWKYDYYEEPLIAIVAAMLDATNEELHALSTDVRQGIKLGWETVKSTLGAIVGELCKEKIGVNLVEFANTVVDKREADLDNTFDRLVSMDKKQIEHSIREIYGEIDVDTYLRKFIAFKVNLGAGKARDYIKKYESYTSMFEFTAQESIDRKTVCGLDDRNGYENSGKDF